MDMIEPFLSYGLGWMPCLLLIILGVATFSYFMLRRPHGFPPGPPAVPLLGSIPFMKHGGGKFHMEFERLAQRYGSVFSLAFGHTWVVVLNDYDVIKEALVDKAKDFSGRIHDPRFIEMFADPSMRGIIDGDYTEEWIQQRHNSMKILRDFGWGKKGIAEKMSEERDILLQSFQGSEKTPINPGHEINVAVMNIIFSMLFGERFEHDDPRLVKLIKHLDCIIAASAKGSEWDFVPLLDYVIPGIKGIIEQFLADIKGLYEFSAEEVDKRRAQDKENPIDEPRDFIEKYLKELKLVKEGKSKISQDWLLDICTDFVVAGSETTTTTLKWALLYMVHNPEVQKKIQSEIDGVVGTPTGRGMTSLSDREKLPYTEAAIMEIQRLSAILPVALVHKTTADVELKGFQIPKDTQVRYNIYSVLHNPKYWDDPLSFKPERFLSKDGTLMKNEKWIPFGMGRRMCLGEQLARQELFMFFTAIIHSFVIRTPEGAELPSLKPAVFGIVLAAPNTKYIFEPRF